MDEPEARKRVVIVKDGYSPLWVIRCQRPCKGDGWCQNRVDDFNRPNMPARWLCWLGSGMSRERTIKHAREQGYEVVE